MKPADADARRGTADLFAAAVVPVVPVVPAMPRSAPQVLKAGGVPPTPTPQIGGRARAKQLWYAAVFPELIDNAHSAAVLQRLCLHAQTFTSLVSIEPPNALLLEIKGSLKLFGPLERLHAGIDACWRRLALQAYSAAAPSTLAALWLARSGARTGNPAGSHPVVIDDLGTLSGRLAGLPIACTAWDTERLQTLHALGVTRMGELLRLPRAGLARRLGAATVRDLDIALGRQFAPRRTFVPRARFRARCDFEEEIENVAYLEKALEPLIACCAQFLRERQAGVQALRLKLQHRVAPSTCMHVGLAGITGERRRLTDVLTQKLGRLELRAPVKGMELISGSLQPLSAASLDIFAGLAGSGRDTAPQLVERLRARLGEDAVYGVASIPEHRPEAAWRRVHELSLATASRMGEKLTGSRVDDGMPRPVWLLDAPLPLTHDWVLEQGPERIESGWWDGRGVARDYYVARRKSKGPKLWVFQERRSKHWYVHGVFA
ncbi:MAG: DNA polymerase Y family protein [Steroidobacteraceae bacterium]